MKNQYLADLGDYGKYGLLRFIASKGIRIGVNWYLTVNDETNDGRFKEYLDRPREPWMVDAELFEELKRIKNRHSGTVCMVEDAGLIPHATYYANLLDYSDLTPDERPVVREKWFRGSVGCLRETDLVFADPDNGISYKMTSGRKNSERYIFPYEVNKYYKSRKDVVFYCHKGRRTGAAWLKVKTDLKSYLGDACIVTLTYHKGTQRSYIFAIHPERFDVYFGLLKEFLETNWRQAFDLEPGFLSVDEFQAVYPTKEEKENALTRMSNEEIDQLISTCHNTYGKIYYASFKK